MTNIKSSTIIREFVYYNFNDSSSVRKYDS